MEKSLACPAVNHSVSCGVRKKGNEQLSRRRRRAGQAEHSSLGRFSCSAGF